MKAQELISVIVPVYNGEAFIENCVASVLEQTYPHFELILVDDGSGDNSPAMLEMFGKRDDRIRVLRQENRGVSAARNSGLDCAGGSYIAFLDGDDSVEPDYLERLYGAMLEKKADIVCCDFVELEDGKPVRRNMPKVLAPRLVTDSLTLLRDGIENREAYGTCVWGKLIRADLAKKCRFQPMKIGEDQVYMFDLFLLSPRVWLDTYQGYRYTVNASGAMQQNGLFSIARCLDEMKMHRYKLQKLPEACHSLQNAYLSRYAMSIHACAHASMYLHGDTQKKRIRDMLLERIGEVISYPGRLSGRAALYLRLYRDTPGLYRLLLWMKDRTVKLK